MSERVLAAMVVLACACEGAHAAKPDDTPSSRRRTVEVVRVRYERLDAPIVLPGQLAAFQAVDLYARTDGFVQCIEVDRGSRVRAGEILARLSAPELDAERAAARARLGGRRATAARLRAASQTPGAVAGNAVEAASADARATRAELARAAALERYLVVRAPFDGTITARFAHPGTLAGPSGRQALLRLEDVDHLRLVVYVPEYAAGAIEEGTEARFRTAAFAGRTFVGRVVRIAHSVDTTTRTMAIEADVDNGDGRLAPGMYVDVDWHVRRAGPSFLVPARAIVQTTSELYVIAVRDGVVHRVPIERGMSERDAVEVFGPLRRDELVLARGREDLAEGEEIEAREASPRVASARSAR